MGPWLVAKAPPCEGAELGRCAASVRAQRLWWPAWRSQGKRPGHWAPNQRGTGQNRLHCGEDTGQNPLASHAANSALLTIQVEVTFTLAPKPEPTGDAPDTYEEKLQKKDREQAARVKERQHARGSVVVDLDDIALWPKSDC